MSRAWRALEQELDRWPPGGAEFWWRDDDATAPSAALDRLRGLGAQPLALAVIPALLNPELPGFLADGEGKAPVEVLQHGFAHRNHEPHSAKKAELGPARPAATVLAELACGRLTLAKSFGEQALGVLVPPWNRIDRSLAADLAEAGYRGLSTFGPRPGERLRLAQVNTHIDIVDWRAGRAFIGAEAAVGLAVDHLVARRLGRVDAREPTGLLTHHLVMDAAAFDFTAEFLARTARHSAVQWRPARHIFAAEMDRRAR